MLTTQCGRGLERSFISLSHGRKKRLDNEIGWLGSLLDPKTAVPLVIAWNTRFELVGSDNDARLAEKRHRHGKVEGVGELEATIICMVVKFYHDFGVLPFGHMNQTFMRPCLRAKGEVVNVRPKPASPRKRKYQANATTETYHHCWIEMLAGHSHSRLHPR